MPGVLVCALVAATLVAGNLQVSGQTPETVEVDPIRCWWRTSAGAVRVGETFSVVLTCAVLQNESVQVVPDESRLDSSVVQMAPFEVVGGSHPQDLYAPNRRFFQYEYRLRVIAPDVIGRDVRIPDPPIQYRVNSTVAANTALQGRDHTYLLPPQSIRVLSVVPADAPDIRDSTSAGFAEAEELAFRASALRIAAVTAMVIAGLVVVLGLVRVVAGVRKQAPTAARGLAAGSILRGALRALAEVQRDAAGGAWTPELVARALAAARVIAAIAVGRVVHQQPANADGGEGRLVATDWRRRSIAVSAAATPQDLAQIDEWAELRNAMVTFTRAQYSRDAVLDSTALDDAVAQSLTAARVLGSAHRWPKSYLRRWMPQLQAEPQA